MTPTPRPLLLPEPFGLPPAAQLRLSPLQTLLAWTPSAQRIVRANPECLYVAERRLQLLPASTPLQDALRWVCGPRSFEPRETTLALPRPGAVPLTLRISRHKGGPGEPSQAVVWLADPALVVLDEGALRGAFGFTPAEARVAVALANGASAAEMATAWGLQVNTVQMHVKRLLAKTRTARQAELVGLLWRSAVQRLVDPMDAGGCEACADT